MAGPAFIASILSSLAPGGGKMFPKKGKGFQGKGGSLRGREQLGYAASIAAALRDELGDTHQAIKTLVRWTGATDRTVKNWLAGTRGPTGEHLISLIRHSDTVFTVLVHAANRETLLVTAELADTRRKLVGVLQTIDELLAVPADQPRS